ncbi:FUSC family protein [Bordetella sp. 15P40C-2]|uniref:FUSC family protein n=1 Tax=Bordetella sp. 15P40C-2 TaxID=2572246 RepID=UPI00132BACC5|nr:FUSC family protein [Bordetella sp. 15P40C-2]MVW71960.1 FUSC family protein [Bordetella sp. 15P40C-2]
MKSAEARRQFMRLLWHDLTDPFPGRLAQTWRIALVCALTTMVAAVYQIPEAALSCYLVFFVMKADAAESSILAVALTVLVGMMLVILVLLTRWTIDVPSMRIVALVIASLILLYLGSASLLGELGGIIALVIAFVLTLLSIAPTGELATRGILYAGLMATMPMACVLIVNMTMGLKPISLLRQCVQDRLLACADLAQHPDPSARARVAEAVWEGQEEALKRLKMTKMLALGRSAERRRLARALVESYRIALAVLALPTSTPQPSRDALAAVLRQAGESLGRGEAVEISESLPPGIGGAEQTMWRALHDLAGTPDDYPSDAPAEPFLRADAFTNREHVRYAVKTTAAAVICYLIYTAVQWQGIHTALITCYVAALGSVAETAHKLVLRITGCLIGAALGIASILFVMPHITSVGAIMLLVFLGTFGAAWVWVGNERASYAGVQVALAFLLTVLQGFGPTFDMDTARDRIVGVLLGNCVLYLVFTRLWPVSAVRRAWESIHDAIANLAALARNTKQAEGNRSRDVRLAYVSRVASHLADCRRVLGLAYFEMSVRRATQAKLWRAVRVMTALRRLTTRLASASGDASGVAPRLENVAATNQKSAAPIEVDESSRSQTTAASRKPVARAANLLEDDIRHLEKLIHER